MVIIGPALWSFGNVYLTTAGKTVTHDVETMITGCDTIEPTPAEAGYLDEDEPGRLEP